MAARNRSAETTIMAQAPATGGVDIVGFAAIVT
jgi:hypothetical protein